LPLTWRALTGGGGEHVFFACPEGVTVRSWQARDNPKLGAGIDGRASAGYVVGPASRHICGRPYAWSVDHHPADVPLAEPPGWLLERVAERSRQSSTEARLGAFADPGALGLPDGQERPDGHGMGGLAADAAAFPLTTTSDQWRALTGAISEYRDAAAAKIAGHLLRRYVDPKLAVGLMVAWNAACCRPPLGYYELLGILDRIADREANRREQLERLEAARQPQPLWPEQGAVL